MFEKIGRMAEKAANQVGVSRRGFLSQLGRGALATAGAVGALLALSKDAQAGIRGNNCVKNCMKQCVKAGGDLNTCYVNCISKCSQY